MPGNGQWRKRCRLILAAVSMCILWPHGLRAENFFHTDLDSHSLHLPENQDVRLLYRTVILSSLYKAKNEKQAVVQREDDEVRVQFRVVANEEFLYFLFLNEKADEFPMIGTGNVSVKRSLIDGAIAGMTVMIRDNSGCFLRIFPYGKRSLLDVYLFDVRICHDIVLPHPIDTVIFEPLSSIISYTRPVIDWYTVLYGGYEHENGNIPAMVETIRDRLPVMNDRDDGAMNERGEYVFIHDGRLQEGENGFNCSGFVKWIVDGLCFPLSGSYLSVERLKIKHLEVRGNSWSDWYEDSRDPYFGLDWSRNCAVAYDEARSGKTQSNPETFDVRSVPYLTYIEDVGYPVSELELLLFLDAARYPGSMYIGSINREYGKEPPLHQHVHLAVFFPVFQADGSFHIIVMERNHETELETFRQDHIGEYIHCIRLNPSGDFSPPLLQ